MTGQTILCLKEILNKVLICTKWKLIQTRIPTTTARRILVLSKEESLLFTILEILLVVRYASIIHSRVREFRIIEGHGSRSGCSPTGPDPFSPAL